MNWKKLSRKQCPKCSSKLIRTKSGWECDRKEPCLVQDRRFFITHERYKKIIENMHQATSNKIARS